ncbi:sentrin-specific protease 1-like [Olea europaea subsp. europaea]|uniref:Sentrin-specific protease 1-like n=1 Tax=Olea europaea subsp. europaea TaxID=158383 RepID=A0A8S0S9U8_OLEEU|nr:sentrin-specific protease 1-like [Olea europaea subsp. europaea]
MLVASKHGYTRLFPVLRASWSQDIEGAFRIVNRMADEKPSTAKLEGPDCFSNPKIVICDLEPLESEMAMSYMNGVQYNKPIQPMSSIESQRRTKRRTERSVEDVGTSGKSVPSVLPLMNSNIGQAHSSDDDDDFVVPPPRRQEPSACGKSPVVEDPTAAHHSQEEPQSHGAQRDDGSPTAEPTSELPVKRVLRPSRVLQSPFVAGQERGKLFKYDDNVVVFEDYKNNVDRVDKSAFMGKSYHDWNVLQGIEPYVKVLPALMNTLRISKKDLDYHETEAKELKVIIYDTLLQQTNGHDCGIFMVLYALYLICGGRCSIP